MATQKTYFGKLTDSAIAMLSASNVALRTLRDLRIKYSEAKKPLEEKLESLQTQRREAIKGGMSTDDAIRQFSTVEVDNALRTLKDKFDADCEKPRQALKDSYALIPNSMYWGYALAQSTGSYDKKGKVEIKNGKKTEEVYLEKSYTNMVKDYIVELGAKPGDEKRLNEFVKLMTTRTSGMISAHKGDDYLKLKSSAQYKEGFMRALLQYLVVEKCVLEEGKDYTLTQVVKTQQNQAA